MYPQKMFRMPPRVLTGAGCISKVGEEVVNLGSKKVLLITDAILVKLGALEKVDKSLRDHNLDFSIFDNMPSEPTDKDVCEGINAYKKNNCDCILAVGGGSVIDTAKAVSIMLTNDGTISDYMGLDKVAKEGVPLIVAATTSGTGSEVTVFTIISDTTTEVKMLIGSSYLMPKVALADPLMTVSMPRELTATTGIDALCHAIEAFVSLKAYPLSDMFALSAIKLLSGNLRQAWANGNNLKARDKVMLGALEAGVAFTNSSVTLVHGMSRPIGVNFHMSHGLSNAVLLSTIMEFSLIANPSKFAMVAEIMGENIYGLSELEAANSSVKAVRNLINDIQIPKLKDCGIDEDKFYDKVDAMADAALESGSPNNNPRQVTRDEIVELYKIAYHS